MQSVTIGKNQAGQRLDKFLHKFLSNAGTGFLYKMLRKKNITLNGKKAEGTETLDVNDIICFYFADETFEKFTGRKVSAEQKVSQNEAIAGLIKEYSAAYNKLKGISILYEDDHIIALNKPVGVLTQKATYKDSSLNEWLIGYLLDKMPSLAEELDTFRPSVCNRLDRNTSGIVLCGKSLAGLQYLSECIKNRTISKYYRTICVGQLENSKKLEGYLFKDHATNKVAIQAQGNGDYIQTAYIPILSNGAYTLLEVELITGKPHQIRAHLASVSHPLVGDFKYGNDVINRKLKQQYGLEHHLLHAYRIEFPNVITGNYEAAASLAGRVITAPCPEHFSKLQQALNLKPERT